MLAFSAYRLRDISRGKGQSGLNLYETPEVRDIYVLYARTAK